MVDEPVFLMPPMQPTIWMALVAHVISATCNLISRMIPLRWWEPRYKFTWRESVAVYFAAQSWGWYERAKGRL